jgi:hypothetical protein
MKENIICLCHACDALNYVTFSNGKTTISTHFWKEKDAGRDPKVKWKILEKNIPSYIPVTKICRLCICEKFNIVMNPQLATLNSRQEIFAHCRHKEPKLIGKPPN